MIRAGFVFCLASYAFAQVSGYDRGVALIQHGHPDEAVPLLSEATQARPSDARAWEALGIAYAAQGMYESAEPAFARACDLDPKLPDAFYYLGRALYALDRFEASIDAMGRANGVTPNSWKVHLGIAQALEGLGNAEQARKEFRAAMSLSHDSDPQPGVAYGLFLLRQGRSQEAIELLAHVLKMFPSSGDAHLQMGRALLERNDVAEAVPHLEAAVRALPDSEQARVLLSKAYVRAGPRGK